MSCSLGCQPLNMSGRTSRPSRHSDIKAWWCQAAAPSQAGKGKASEPTANNAAARPGASGKVGQQKRSHSGHRGHQELADLATFRQKKAASAAKQASRMNGLHRAKALRGLVPLPEPFIIAMQRIKVKFVLQCDCSIKSIVCIKRMRLSFAWCQSQCITSMRCSLHHQSRAAAQHFSRSLPQCCLGRKFKLRVCL